MGWIKEPIKETKELFCEIIRTLGDWNYCIGDSSCPYEFFSDYIKNNFDVTLKQCDELCRMIKNYYNINEFYFNELKATAKNIEYIKVLG